MTTTTERPARPAAEPGSRLPSLTGLRFLAALLVCGFHATYENVFADRAVNDAFAQLFSKAGWVGVSFFFVLSGFVLTWSARPYDTARGFWRRRFFKIYPNHLLTFAAAVVLMLLAGQSVPGLLPNLLLVQTWLPDVDVILSVNPVSWSLACEALFYLAFPALLVAVRAIRPERLWWGAGALIAAVCCVPLVAEVFVPAGPDMDWLAVSEEHYWFIFAFPPVRALEFVLGMVMARIVRGGRWPAGPGVLPAVLALAAAYALALKAPFAYGLAAVTLIPVTWLITAAAAADLRGTASPFRGRAMVRLGELSFAFYVLHRLVQSYGHRALGAERTWSTPAAVGVLLLSVAVTLLLAAAVFTAYERPLVRRFGGRPRGRRHEPPTPGPVHGGVR